MRADRRDARIITRIPSKRGIWWLAFGLIALYVTARMGAFALWADVATPAGPIRLPNTYASVDHPFHVARAETLWRELASGNVLRWVGQHQGGYPVEFYPLGEAWLEVVVRALSLGSLPAEGAHTLSVIAVFLLPGVAYAALARLDDWSPAVAFIAFVIHLALPGSWYDGGYTELVQWGLVTNVAGAVAALLMLPALIRFLTKGDGWIGAFAALLAAAAVYSNPRSLLALAALGAGAFLAVTLFRPNRDCRGDACIARAANTVNAMETQIAPSTSITEGGGATHPGIATAGDAGVAPTAIVQSPANRHVSLGLVTLRLAQVALSAALLAAPQLLALARFGDLYAFVRYSGYDGIAAYALASVKGVTWPVVALSLIGLMLGLTVRQRPGSTPVAMALMLYILLTATIAFVPAASRLAPQLEPTRLMPLQRFLTIYLAAVAVFVILDWLLSRIVARRSWASPVVATGIAAAFLLVQTRPLAGLPPDPASPAVPPVGLYAVSTSAQPEQFDLEVAVRAAAAAARPGTGILVLGSALSWHQQLWAPLWTERPLYYDNWLWYWHPNHAGTPGYRFLAGHHYPDPEQTLQRDYLTRHGIGAVVVTGEARNAAASSPLLRPLREGTYDAHAVLDPVTTLTFSEENTALLAYGNQEIDAVAQAPGQPVIARVNWHPRWTGYANDRPAPITPRDDGYIVVAVDEPARTGELRYTIQPLDWAARLLAAAGVAGVGWLVMRRRLRPRAGHATADRPSSPALIPSERGAGSTILPAR